MTNRTLRNLTAVVAGYLLIFLLAGVNVHSQSQALNGQIEGWITDQTGALVAEATVLATNVETGYQRSLFTKAGFYSIPLLPLGTYRITVEAPHFRKLIRDGITLVTGQSATVNLQLEPGEVKETVTISGDAPVADPGKTDLGRVMNNREVHNLPLPTRNPLNFVILQANVTGRPNLGFNYPQININGFARRVYHQLDGNSNTRGNVAGARLLFISDTYVQEVQLVTNGFAAEFGNTTGMIANMITPSGTNDLHGSAVYLFRRPSFYARPFFFSAEKFPDNVTNNFAGTVGGPIIRDRWHFYFGYEYVKRDDNTRATRQVTISEANKLALIAAGLPASIFVPAIPGQEYGSHFIARTDAQLNASNRLTIRFNASDPVSTNAIQGGFNTLERSSDVVASDQSLGVQLVSFSSRILNELRFQFSRSTGNTRGNDVSGTGPSITISNIANFGSPIGTGAADNTKVTQVQNNVTLTGRSHVIKLGGGILTTHNFDRNAAFAQYTFPSILSYVAARSAANPLDRYGYTRYEERFGELETRNTSTFLSSFVQDDWKVSRRLKINFGLRYDLYLVPDADPSAPFSASRKFEIDSNNFAPRFGLVVALSEGTRPLVLRAGGGIYYEPPWLRMYRRALQENGNPRSFTRVFCGDSGGANCPRDPLAPAFPTTFSGSLPAGATLPPQDILTVSPDFENMYAIHSNIQLEQALTDNLSLAVGYVHSAGRHIPVHRSINTANTIRFLSDGRPVFGPERLDPRFNIIQLAESAGVSQYDGLAVQLAKRFSKGIQFTANYTLSRAVDDAPEQNVTYMDGNQLLRALSDPTNRSLDKGYSYGDQRHTFVLSLVANPKFDIRNNPLRFLLNHNQFGIITTANSGERFSVRTAANLDLNNDGLFFPDRPVGIKRNAGKTPPQFNLDLRYSRFFNFGERYKLEAILEVQNLFNVKSIIAYNNLTVNTDPVTGEIIGPLPDFKARNQSVALESRQAQLGLKFHF
jgi:hypothetical protein